MAQHGVALTCSSGWLRPPGYDFDIQSSWISLQHQRVDPNDPTTSNRSKAMPQLGQLVDGRCQVVSVERHVLRDDLQEVLTGALLITIFKRRFTISSLGHTGLYRILPEYTAICTFWPNPTPNTFKNTFLLWLGLGMWFFSSNSYDKLLRWRAEHKSFFPEAHQQTHTCLDESKLAFKRSLFSIHFANLSLSFSLSLSLFPMVGNDTWILCLVLVLAHIAWTYYTGPCAWGYSRATTCWKIMSSLGDAVAQWRLSLSLSLSRCAPEMLNARVSNKYIVRTVQKLKWLNSVDAL